MKTVTSTIGSLLKSEGDFSETNFILSFLPADGLNTTWLCFMSANIYHGFSAAWGVIGKSPVATTFNKVIRPWLIVFQHCEEWAAAVTRSGDRTWRSFWGKNRYSSLPDMLWVVTYLLQSADPVLLGRGDARSPWADDSNDIFPEDFPAFVWRPLWGISRFEDWCNISIANQISYVLF